MTHSIHEIRVIAADLQTKSDRQDPRQELISRIISLCDEYCKLTDEESHQSKQSFIEAIIKYVDTKVEYEIEGRQRDEEGYLPSCREEEKAMEAAKEALMKCADSPD